MLKSIEGNFDNSEVNELLTKHFIELRAASPEGSAHVLDIPGLRVNSIKFWSLWDDKKLFGEVIHTLKFSDAIEQGILSDYELVVIGGDDQMIAEKINWMWCTKIYK